LLVLLDYVEACNKEDKDRVVAEAAAQFESWKLEVARTISTTKETKVTVLTRVSVHPIKARFVTKFIVQQEEIAGPGNGDRPGQAEEDAHAASDLIELAQPLLDELWELIADEDFLNVAS
jgi:hypothetical protein